MINRDNWDKRTFFIADSYRSHGGGDDPWDYDIELAERFNEAGKLSILLAPPLRPIVDKLYKDIHYASDRENPVILAWKFEDFEWEYH